MPLLTIANSFYIGVSEVGPATSWYIEKLGLQKVPAEMDDPEAARRLARPADAPPLAIIRSLAYFAPVIDEVLSLPVSPEYFRYLRQRIATFPSAK